MHKAAQPKEALSFITTSLTQSVTGSGGTWRTLSSMHSTFPADADANIKFLDREYATHAHLSRLMQLDSEPSQIAQLSFLSCKQTHSLLVSTHFAQLIIAPSPSLAATSLSRV